MNKYPFESVSSRILESNKPFLDVLEKSRQDMENLRVALRPLEALQNWAKKQQEQMNHLREKLKLETDLKHVLDRQRLVKASYDEFDEALSQIEKKAKKSRRLTPASERKLGYLRRAYTDRIELLDPIPELPAHIFGSNPFTATIILHLIELHEEVRELRVLLDKWTAEI